MSFLSEFQKAEARRPIQVTAKTEVTEKRAPTDESVRLLREMERAAEDRLVMAMKCDATAFSFRAFIFFDPANNPFEKRLRVRFSLGDNEYDIDASIDVERAKTKEEAIVLIRDLVAKQVANQILQGSFSDLVKAIGR